MPSLPALLRRQLALDFCCAEEEVADSRNHFTEYRRREGRRRFHDDEPRLLSVAAVNGKLLFTGRPDIVRACQDRYADAPGEWLLDWDSLRELSALLAPFGCRIKMAHPFLVAAAPVPAPAAPAGDFAARWFTGTAIERFRGDARFAEAFAFNAEAPDEIGVAATLDGQILGMAGASSDSPAMWQIGVNVDPPARKLGLAAWLVALLRDAVLARGKLPFYGTAASHTASLRVALNAGFRPAWAEIATEPLSAAD